MIVVEFNHVVHFIKKANLTTMQRKFQGVFWLRKFNSVTLVHREYRREFPEKCQQLKETETVERN